jgi:hypothetical protein
MSTWINVHESLWLPLFVISWAAMIVSGIVQAIRKKDFWDTPMGPVLAALHAAWVIAFLIPLIPIAAGLTAIIAAVLYLSLGVVWVWFRLFGKPKH